MGEDRTFLREVENDTRPKSELLDSRPKPEKTEEETNAPKPKVLKS